MLGWSVFALTRMGGADWLALTKLTFTVPQMPVADWLALTNLALPKKAVPFQVQQHTRCSSGKIKIKLDRKQKGGTTVILRIPSIFFPSASRGSPPLPQPYSSHRKHRATKSVGTLNTMNCVRKQFLCCGSTLGRRNAVPSALEQSQFGCFLDLLQANFRSAGCPPRVA